MKIITIEPTPSPNSMKIVVSEKLSEGESYNYRKDEIDQAPELIKSLLAIRGVRGIYHVLDFLAVERVANVKWEPILEEIEHVFSGGKQESTIEEKEEQPLVPELYGEVYVHIQTYKEIPLQIRVFDTESEIRVGLPDRFIMAMKIVETGEVENYILLRKWNDYGIRYGEKHEIGQEVLDEIEAAYPRERLQQLVEQASDEESTPEEQLLVYPTLEEFSVPEWETRFQLLDQMPDPRIADIPLLEQALEDEKMSIRRLATVYLGMIEDEKVIPSIEKALQDKSWAVRRTAGDCMSDLGFQGFERVAIQLLQDKNKLVRWRAAMFLYETGTEQALPALREAENDEEFEVKLQVKMALARIEEGEAAQGSIWKQMTEMSKLKNDSNS